MSGKKETKKNVIPFEENQSAKYVNSGIFGRKVRRRLFVTFKPPNISNPNAGKEIGNKRITAKV